MRKYLLLFSALLLVSCLKDRPGDTEFDSYKNSFIDAYWKLNPEAAVANGNHAYDSLLVVPNAESRAKMLEFVENQREKLQDFDPDDLSTLNKIDCELLKNLLAQIEFSVKELKSWQWNPAEYNACGQFSEILTKVDAKNTKKVNELAYRLQFVPEYYAAARENLKQVTKEHLELAIAQNDAAKAVFTTDLPQLFKNSTLSKNQKDKNLKACEAAAKAVTAYVKFLEGKRNGPFRSFRLGTDLYAKKFDLEINSTFSSKEIYERALKHKDSLHARMYNLAKELWPKYMKNEVMPTDKLLAIRKVIDVLSLDHVKPEEFQSAIEKQIPELERFVREKQLIYIDSTKPLVVRKEPAYMAGVAGASISSPGPYDIEGNTYYNVGSLSGWDAARAESYLREYNNYTLQILNIHEAIPGHYAQLVYSNQSKSLVKSLFGNGAMIEGWAVYTELMMLENGYKATPEMWLMYYKWNLRSTCNTIIDVGIHTKNWSEKQVIDLLTREAFQQTAEAEGKWKRATLSQVQLCNYYTGFSDIVDLRAAYRKKMVDKFNLKQFHEQFLSYGSAPVPLIRTAMLE
ncbi:DUF885 domain-containing protein [Flavobacterium sp.]|uniref:DUF885 domain-containing protein n=1 Tax=Flavobacterium sp. TaxID=239 RepID=UPI003B9B880F